MQSCAVLEEFLQQEYVEQSVNDLLEKETSPLALLRSTHNNWIYSGKLGYIVDSSGYVHYYLILENLPNDVVKDIKGGKSIGKDYNDYVQGNDFYGVTEDLKVYYSASEDNVYSATNIEFLKEKGDVVVFESGSNYAKLINGNTSNEGVNINKARNLTELKINSSHGINNLNEFYNFITLKTLELDGVTLENLNGLEYATEVETIFIKRSIIGDYSSIAKLSKIKYFFVEMGSDEEIEKICNLNKGIGGKDIPSLQYLGFYGQPHFRLKYHYENLYNSFDNITDFSHISYLDNLSKVTKESINYLLLNNNSLSSIENLYKFKNLLTLRLEGNQITSLKGLYNEDTSEGPIQLKNLLLRNNKLGKDLEGDSINPNQDALSALATSILNISTNKYSFQFRFDALKRLDLETNTDLYWVDYLSNSNLTELYLAYCTLLKNSSVLNISEVINKIDSSLLSLDVKYMDYLAEYDNDITTLNLSGKKMTVMNFNSIMNGKTKLLNLNLDNLKLYIDDGLTTEVDATTFNSTINLALSELIILKNVKLTNLPNLSTIDWVQYNTDLKYLNLLNSGVIDLTNLNTYCTKIYALRINNSNIDITKIQDVINRSYDNSGTEKNYASGKGVLLVDAGLRSQLINCTEIEKFYCYDKTSSLSDASFEWHLENTKITDCFYTTYVSGVFYLPVSCTYFHAQVMYPSGNLSGSDIARIFIGNQNELENLKTVQMHWFRSATEINAICEDLPNLKTLDFYGAAQILYVDEIMNKSVENLYIYGYSGNETSESLENKNLKGINNFENLKKLIIRNERKLTSLPKELEECDALEQIYLYNTGITNLYAIRNLTNLNTLDLRSTPIMETGFYEDLEISVNVHNIGILRDLNKTYSKLNNSLEVIYLQETRIEDFSIIDSLTWLNKNWR